jgi:hypothetical protein
MFGVSARTLLLVAVLVLGLVGSLAAVAVPSVDDARDAPSPEVDNGSVDAVHADGITGENASVAILDPTGFDTDDPAYTDAVAAAQSFGAGATVGPDVGDEHGTRSVREIASVAPNASLYLAGFDGEAGYGRAMAWAVRQDVDVVVVPAAFHGTLRDGDSLVANVTERAIARDVVVVAAAGNTARGTYRATYDRVRGGALVVEDGIRNYLRGDSQVVRAWLSWDDPGPSGAYALELYRVTPEGPRLVARSVPYAADRTPNARLNVRVEGDTHFVVVRGPDRPTGASVTVTSSTHALQHVTVRGSLVAPATAEGVVTVGAWNAVDGRLAAYSAGGPTTDGRQGVDVVAAARATDGFRGTSVAAARAGGVAALVRAVRPNASPTTVERYLETTARDVGVAGPTPRTGSGRLRPDRAVSAALRDARNGTTAPATPGTANLGPAAWVAVPDTPARTPPPSGSSGPVRAPGSQATVAFLSPSAVLGAYGARRAIQARI